MASTGNEHGGWSSRLFDTEEELDYFLGWRDGIAPAYPKHTEVDVQERAPEPEDPAATDEAKEDTLDEMVEEVTESIARSR
jgi:hypothetical protein